MNRQRTLSGMGEILVGQTLAQDPNEQFDVVDIFGTSTGVTKRRTDIHRDGDWHRAIHVWIYGVNEDTPFIVVQRRGLDKDIGPGALDATAAGHLAAGETPEDAFREIEEELGIAPEPEALLHAGTRIIAGEYPPHRINREVQEIYLLRDDRPLRDYRPNPVEVDALIRLPLDAWLRFLFERPDGIEASLLTSATGEERNHRITLDQLSRSPDRYYHRVAVGCDRALRGERYLVV